MSARNRLANKAARREERAIQRGEMELRRCPMCPRYSELVLHAGACGICFTGVKYVVGVMSGAIA